MSLTLSLPPALENQLRTEAIQMGLSLAQYIQQRLSSRPAIDRQPRTGLEWVTYWQTEGLFGYRSDISNSQSHARALRAQVGCVPTHHLVNRKVRRTHSTELI